MIKPGMSFEVKQTNNFLMKLYKKIIPIVITVFLLGSGSLLAQKKGGHHGGGHRVHPHKHPGHAKVIIKPSPFRPAKIVVYHPYWGPKRVIHRRWVYFPKYNIYWDNWRNHYVFWNGSIWFSQPSPPPAIVNINIDNEKHYELKEDEDDVDDIYQGNDNHKTEYKPD
jgi:hypothetical protein